MGPETRYAKTADGAHIAYQVVTSQPRHKVPYAIGRGGGRPGGWGAMTARRWSGSFAGPSWMASP
jgi:hypothetical protein